MRSSASRAAPPRTARCRARPSAPPRTAAPPRAPPPPARRRTPRDVPGAALARVKPPTRAHAAASTQRGSTGAANNLAQALGEPRERIPAWARVGSWHKRRRLLEWRALPQRPLGGRLLKGFAQRLAAD